MAHHWNLVPFGESIPAPVFTQPVNVAASTWWECLDS